MSDPATVTRQFDRSRALRYDELFVDLWKDAEPELRPQVSEVKQKIAQLAADRKQAEDMGGAHSTR